MRSQTVALGARGRSLLLVSLFAVASALFAGPPESENDGYALATAFTYQGRLERKGAPADGRFDLTFELFSARDGGVSLGREDRFGVVVRNGAFATELDFGEAIRAEENTWLEISVRADGQDGYATLTPRSRLAGESLGLCTVNSDVLINGALAVDPVGATTGIDVACCNEADLDGGGQIRLGGSLNDLLFDTNEIQARSLLQGGAFYLNPHGGNVGVGIESGAAAPLHLPSGPDVQVGGGGALVVGSPSGVSLAIDQNEIMVRNGGSTSTLHLQADGGAVSLGGPLLFGYQQVSASSTIGVATAFCPAGTLVLGGGCQTDDGSSSPDVLIDALPFNNSAGSGFHCNNDDADDSTITAHAICARVQ